MNLILNEVREMNKLQDDAYTLLQKINDDTVTFDDIDFNFINKFASSINHTIVVSKVSDSELWTNFIKSIQEDELTRRDAIMYRRELEKVFAYCIPYIERVLKESIDFYMFILTIKAILMALDNAIKNYDLINELTR